MKTSLKTLALIGSAVILSAMLAGCAGGQGEAKGEAGPSSSDAVSYEVYSGDQLDAEGISLLGEGPAPQEGWVAADGRLQVQIVAGSIPGISVSEVRFAEDGEIAVTLEASEGPSTMDIAFYEILADVGDREVSSVTLDRGDGSGGIALERLG